MARFPYLTYFSHVLPLDYELSLTPYEIISKLLRWLDELTKTINGDSAAIQNLQERVKALEDKGFTNAQLREVLDEMIADGEFDFLVDLITAKTELWDVVGLTPKYQILAENIDGIDLSLNWYPQSMAIGVIEGVKVLMAAFSISGTQNAAIITYNMTSGQVIASNYGEWGHMNHLSFNPIDKLFYTSPVSNDRYFRAFDFECHMVKTIENLSYGVAHPALTFNRENGNAYLWWIKNDDSIMETHLNEVRDFNTLTSISELDYERQGVYFLRDRTNTGRQDIYNDGVYIYMPSQESLSGMRYQRQDVFAISSLEFVMTQMIDSKIETEGGDYFEGHYYQNIPMGNTRSGLIYEAAVRKNDFGNDFYMRTIESLPVHLQSTTPFMYANADNTSLFADGKSKAHGVNRIYAAVINLRPLYTYPYALNINGDFSDQYMAQINLRCNLFGLRINGESETTTFLPEMQITDFVDLYINHVTFKGSGTAFEAVNCTSVRLSDVIIDCSDGFTNGIVATNSYIKLQNKVGFSNGSPTYYIVNDQHSMIYGRYYPDYDDTSEYYYARKFHFDMISSAAGTQYHVFGHITNAGLFITGFIPINGSVTINEVICRPDANNIQKIVGSFIPSGRFYINDYFYFDTSTNEIKARVADIPTGQYDINFYVPVNEITT